jgi:outer membrane protein assembly factor BamE (lipoprotein component of BamABCDE complex)
MRVATPRSIVRVLFVLCAQCLPSLVGVCMLCGALAGCSLVSTPQHHGYVFTNAETAGIHPGMTETEIRARLGPPTFTASFGDPIWYYVAMDTRHSAFLRPRVTQYRGMALAFSEGVLTHIEERTLQDTVSVTPNDRATPTIAQEEDGLLRQLFGGIGQFNNPGATQGNRGGSTR